MKRMLYGFVIWAGVSLAPVWASSTEMSVQIRNGQLRERPSFLGAVKADVAYGDRVMVEQSQGPWRLVSASGQSGWIHESALTRQRIKLTAGETDVAGAANQQELALAGKGFNAQVEGEFRAQNQAVDFTWVDRMEKMGIETKKLMAFLKAGGVEPVEGGRK